MRTLESWMVYVKVIAAKEWQRTTFMDPDEFESAATLALWQTWQKFPEHESKHFQRYLAMRVRGECVEAIRHRWGRDYHIEECPIYEADAVRDREDVAGTAITAVAIEQLRAMVTQKQWDMALTWANHKDFVETAKRYGCSKTNVVLTGQRTVARLQKMVS